MIYNILAQNTVVFNSVFNILTKQVSITHLFHIMTIVLNIYRTSQPYHLQIYIRPYTTKPKIVKSGYIAMCQTLRVSNFPIQGTQWKTDLEDCLVLFYTKCRKNVWEVYVATKCLMTVGPNLNNGLTHAYPNSEASIKCVYQKTINSILFIAREQVLQNKWWR